MLTRLTKRTGERRGRQPNRYCGLLNNEDLWQCLSPDTGESTTNNANQHEWLTPAMLAAQKHGGFGDAEFFLSWLTPAARQVGEKWCEAHLHSSVPLLAPCLGAAGPPLRMPVPVCGNRAAKSQNPKSRKPGTPLAIACPRSQAALPTAPQLKIRDKRTFFPCSFVPLSVILLKTLALPVLGIPPGLDLCGEVAEWLKATVC